MQKVTIIISVYKDVENLSCILDALRYQTKIPDEIIISEDGRDSSMQEYVKSICKEWPNIIHLTQNDSGFRKNRALNRAVLRSNNEILIFIDGDCVPHNRFIEMHSANCTAGNIVIGRRAEIGPVFSRIIKNHFWFMRLIQNKLFYLFFSLLMTLDKGKNIESGIYSPFINKFQKNKPGRLLGCNFSICKQHLIDINGFNEDYIYPGTGEDSDIEWRLKKNGLKTVNIKFIAIEYHMHHISNLIYSAENNDIFDYVKKNNVIFCKNGISNH